MENISAKIHKNFTLYKKRKLINIGEIKDITVQSEQLFKTIAIPERLKKYDPLHAIHITTQNLVSIFAEQMSVLPELKEYHKIISKVQDRYIPGFPPMSPITPSYFTLWVFYDFAFGIDKECMGSLLVDLAEVLEFPPNWLDMVKIQMQSRMGIYEHCGFIDEKILLKELITDEEYLCICPTGYLGKKGELWLTRILPSPVSWYNYGVAFTTPYLLLNHTKTEWMEYFKRNGISADDSEFKTKLNLLMKRGKIIFKDKSQIYWHEYILDGYHGYKNEVIFLMGIPDLPKTLPHGGMYDD